MTIDSNGDDGMIVKAKIKDIASFSKGSQINGDDLLLDGEYDYLNGGIAPSGKWNAANAPACTVTISEGGNSCGYVNYMEKPFWCGAHCYFLYDTISNSRYLYYAFKSQEKRLMRLRTGACMPNIKKADLGNFEIQYDTDEIEQARITSVLRKTESIIAKRKQELSALDDLIKARFVEMFPANSFPRVDLIDLIIQGAGLSYGIVQPGDDGTGNMGVLRPVDMVDGRISTASIKYIDRSIGDGFRKTELTGDELLITVRGTTGITALTDERFKGMNVTRGIAVVRYERSKINPVYLNAFLNTDESQRYIKEHTRGATLQQINLSDLRVQKVLLPPAELQDEFATFAQHVNQSKTAILRALDETQLLFNSLMQQYFG